MARTGWSRSTSFSTSTGRNNNCCRLISFCLTRVCCPLCGTVTQGLSFLISPPLKQCLMRAYRIVLSPSQRFLNFFTPSPPSRGRRILVIFIVRERHSGVEFDAQSYHKSEGCKTNMPGLTLTQSWVAGTCPSRQSGVGGVKGHNMNDHT